MHAPAGATASLHRGGRCSSCATDGAPRPRIPLLHPGTLLSAARFGPSLLRSSSPPPPPPPPPARPPGCAPAAHRRAMDPLLVGSPARRRSRIGCSLRPPRSAPDAPYSARRACCPTPGSAQPWQCTQQAGQEHRAWPPAQAALSALSALSSRLCFAGEYPRHEGLGCCFACGQGPGPDGTGPNLLSSFSIYLLTLNYLLNYLLIYLLVLTYLLASYCLFVCLRVPAGCVCSPSRRGGSPRSTKTTTLKP